MGEFSLHSILSAIYFSVVNVADRDIPARFPCCCLISTFRNLRRSPLQNPDTPAEKPALQSYHVDLSSCGPMMLDALVSSSDFELFAPIC